MPDYYYHGTAQWLLPRIREEGLRSDLPIEQRNFKPEILGKKPAIFVTPKIRRAFYYAPNDRKALIRVSDARLRTYASYVRDRDEGQGGLRVYPHAKRIPPEALEVCVVPEGLNPFETDLEEFCEGKWKALA